MPIAQRVAAAFLGAAMMTAPVLAQAPGGEIASLRQEVRELRDREEIRQLLIDYGRTIDARDFPSFGRLFAREGEYVSGPGAVTKGPEAIARGLAAIFADNPSGIAGPNFHLFFNETIELDGDRATARSMALFVAPGADRNPQALMLASYADSLVREDGRWRFLRRVVSGRIPAPAAAR